MDEEYKDSVDTSTDMDISDVDVSDDISADIPDDIPEDVPEDDYSDADISEAFSEDVSEKLAVDDIEFDENNESIEEDFIEPEIDELDESINDIEEDSIEESDDNAEGHEKLDGIPEDTDGFDEKQTKEAADDAEEITEDYELTEREEAFDENISEDVVNEDTPYEPWDVGDTVAGDSQADAIINYDTSMPTELNDTSEINSISDYMNSHNYGLDDFATYSQDPQWRQLMRQEYPDYELPEMTQESANAQLSQYMSDHNYGVDDYAEYSQDPIWRELHSTAFPDDELPPVVMPEVAENKEGIFSSIFGRENDVTENQPENQILQSEQNVAGLNDLSQEYDTSFEAQELRDMGIKNVDLRDCSPEYRGDIVDAVRDMVRENPELRDQLSDVRCYPMKDGTYASYGPTDQGVPFGGRLNLNSKYFSSNTLREDLTGESQQGWSIPNASPRSIVSHELGHGVHLGLCAKSCGITPGTIPDTGSYRTAVRQYMDDVHADRIVETACKDLGVEFDSWDFANQLTRYGASNYGEAIAEAVAEVRNNSNPRPMASAIYSRLMQYKNNMNGGTLI